MSPLNAISVESFEDEVDCDCFPFSKYIPCSLFPMMLSNMKSFNIPSIYKTIYIDSSLSNMPFSCFGHVMKKKKPNIGSVEPCSNHKDKLREIILVSKRNLNDDDENVELTKSVLLTLAHALGGMFNVT